MTLARGSKILVDTNVIIEAHRCGVWSHLCQAYQLVTVEKCAEETQTGHQNRKPEQTIDFKLLKSTLNQLVAVNDEACATLQVRYENTASLDAGERELLAHALERNDKFLICSPDMAALRATMALGWGDLTVSLEEMTDPIGVRLCSPLKSNYSKNWLSVRRTNIILS